MTTDAIFPETLIERSLQNKAVARWASQPETSHKTPGGAMVTNLRLHPFDDRKWLIAVLFLRRFATEDPFPNEELRALAEAVRISKFLYLEPDDLPVGSCSVIRHHEKASLIQLSIALEDLWRLFLEHFAIHDVQVDGFGNVISFEAYADRRRAALEPKDPQLVLKLEMVRAACDRTG